MQHCLVELHWTAPCEFPVRGWEWGSGIVPIWKTYAISLHYERRWALWRIFGTHAMSVEERVRGRTKDFSRSIPVLASCDDQFARHILSTLGSDFADILALARNCEDVGLDPKAGYEGTLCAWPLWTCDWAVFRLVFLEPCRGPAPSTHRRPSRPLCVADLPGVRKVVARTPSHRSHQHLRIARQMPLRNERCVSTSSRTTSRTLTSPAALRARIALASIGLL